MPRRAAVGCATMKRWGTTTQPEIRIGDRERREVDARLQQAHADGVLTLTEYDERAGAVLGRPHPQRPRPAHPRPAAPARRGPRRPAGAEAAAEPVAGAGRRKGLVHRALRGLAGAALVGAALYGGRVRCSPPTTGPRCSAAGRCRWPAPRTGQVGALFGRVTVRVPDDVRVRTSGTVVFGSIECAAACQGGPEPARGRGRRQRRLRQRRGAPAERAAARDGDDDDRDRTTTRTT